MLVTLAGWAAVAAVGVSRPSAVFPPGDPVRGAQIAQTCLACHGQTAVAVGNPPVVPPRLLHQRATSIFYALQDYRSGRRKSDVMRPLAAALNDQQMRDVAVYLAGSAPHIPTLQMANSPAYAFTQANCGICHGETGLGEIEGTPVLTGQDKSYIEHALAEYRSGGRKEPTMRGVAHSLTPAQMALAATYFSAQSGLEREP